MARPASGKSLLLSVKAGPGGKTQTETPTEDEAFSPMVFGVWGEFMGPSSDLTNPLTIHHLQQLV